MKHPNNIFKDSIEKIMNKKIQIKCNQLYNIIILLFMLNSQFDFMLNVHDKRITIRHFLRSVFDMNSSRGCYFFLLLSGFIHQE